MNQKKVISSQYLKNFDLILNTMANKMLTAKITKNITIDFIRCMIPHHQAAIDMCNNLLNYTKNQDLISICNSIISMQTKGIQEMSYIEQTTPYFQNQMEDVKNYLNTYLNITLNMIEQMGRSLTSSNIDLDFISEMIPHHEGAIKMCENLLKYEIDPRLEIVAKNIIFEQQNGINNLKKVESSIIQKED